MNFLPVLMGQPFAEYETLGFFGKVDQNEVILWIYVVFFRFIDNSNPVDFLGYGV